MLIQMPVTAPRNDTAAARPLPPCAQARGLNGLACTGQCGSCPAVARPAGMGAFYETWPAPFNNPLILAALVVAAFVIFGGGFKLFGGGGRSSSGRRAKLRLIQAKAQEERARVLAS